MGRDLKALTSYEGYLRDVQVGLGLASPGESPECQLWLPETLFNRLLYLGRAYDLHVLKLVEFQEDTRLNSLQCEGLEDEVEFLNTLVSDPALQFVLSDLRDAVEAQKAKPSHDLCFVPP